MSVSSAETLALGGIAVSIESIGDVEYIAAGCVDWYNSRRLHSTNGNVPPYEFEAAYDADLGTPSRPVLAPDRSGKEPGTVHSNAGRVVGGIGVSLQSRARLT